MIVWLASYPRSGNTLTRLLCWYVFGLDSSTTQPKNPVEKQLTNICTGFKQFDDFNALKTAWIETPEIHIVKTHYKQNKDEILSLGQSNKTIFVVRDGRASYISYYHFVFERSEKTLEYIIQRNPMFCGGQTSWSCMLQSWNPLERKDTLLVKYEDIILKPKEVIDKLAVFLGMEPKNQWHNNFDQLKSKYPHFFREGKIDSWRNEWNNKLEKLYWQHNKNWMIKLGYPPF